MQSNRKNAAGAYLRGAGQVFNITGVTSVRRARVRPGTFATDAQALRGDWSVVVNDLAAARKLQRPARDGRYVTK